MNLMQNYKRKNHKTPRLVIADAYTIGSNPFESEQAKNKSVYYITVRKFLETIDKDLYTKEDTRYIFKGLFLFQFFIKCFFRFFNLLL